MSFKRRIYLDYASLTPIDPRVLKVVKKYSNSDLANPSSWHKEGVMAKKVLDLARKNVANFIHAHLNEIVFTGSGTEANNLAILGVVEKLHSEGKAYSDMNIIISAIEHSSIMEICKVLKRKGVDIIYISVSKSGIILLDELKKKINSKTVLVSIMTVNNEIGTIQPIREIAGVVRHERARRQEQSERTRSDNYLFFHTDVAQAALYLNLNVEKLGVDLLTLDGSKVYGPRGIGALYVKRGISIQPIIYGGGQESGLRSGTENLPAIAGLAKALELASVERDTERARILQLKNLFINGLKKIRSDIILNPSGISESVNVEKFVSPHILNVSIPGIDNEFFILQLDAKGIAVSTKSACLKDEDQSYVLKAIGADGRTSVRFSFGRWTKARDIKRVLKMIVSLPFIQHFDNLFLHA